MASYVENTFYGERILLDGHHFERNRFVNCVLVYGGGPLQMVGNQLVGVRWEFIDAAGRTINLLSSFYQAGGDGKLFVEHLVANFHPKAPPPVSEAATATPSPEAATNSGDSKVTQEN